MSDAVLWTTDRRRGYFGAYAEASCPDVVAPVQRLERAYFEARQDDTARGAGSMPRDYVEAATPLYERKSVGGAGRRGIFSNASSRTHTGAHKTKTRSARRCSPGGGQARIRRRDRRGQPGVATAPSARARSRSHVYMGPTKWNARRERLTDTAARSDRAKVDYGSRTQGRHQRGARDWVTNVTEPYCSDPSSGRTRIR